ncbi:flagella cluster protein [Salinarchaeum sp. IM2453]|uniref:DUF7385 family protein n=1 Tax=Salinarchaeum sp. IM2453 TaxID=2862870 RepID=UPI001C84021A|nr:flagella cluster protein [Salinarchaeum sp. IM2453]QZA87982.1 flagella cluster protein [Salinarchaeum sp. IM2453]
MGPKFSVHDHRHALKQLRDGGSTKLYETKAEIDCPVCGKAFQRLFITEKKTTSFPENDGRRFCILNEEQTVMMFRH